MKWRQLQHNGVALPPPYEAKGLSIRIKGRSIRLTPEQEEMAYAFAKKKDTPYVKDRVFVLNFLSDFLKLFPEEYRSASIEDIDFSEVYAYVDREREMRLNMDKDTKRRLASERKRLREQLKSIYGYAIVDGERYEVANWMVEPPGIFMGRGEHPLRGRWKARVEASDIILNLGEDAPVPEANWKAIVHDHDSIWLAKWVDRLTGKEKYVWLADSSRIRQERDKAKYDTAMRLAKQIDRVVARIEREMRARDEKRRKVATVCYLIYRLAMRVGDEKDADEADTVGASTLRVEHIRFNGDGKSIEFDFLGKDSVRWQKSVVVESEMDAIAYRNLQEFVADKREGEEIFAGINSRHVNRFLSSIMDGLTAKAFRTYLATDVVRGYLAGINGSIAGESEHVKVYHAKLANLQAAIACNHKRAVPKNFEESLRRKEERLRELMGKEVKTKRQEERLKERIERLRLQIDLARQCRDYNLATSLRNYIDPRLFYAWCRYVGIDWARIYTASLQRKFQWVRRSNARWDTMLKAYGRDGNG
ncbi:MAG: hypothetical protein RMJ59_06535 [Candidatus Nitrosocaldus sp.]|nr:hypothetical protein [Candidatus Nitrosocaldus sp.]